MFKMHAIAMLAGAALLFGGTSESKAAGLTLDAGFLRGDTILTVGAFDPVSNPNGGAALELFPGLLTAGGRNGLTVVSIVEEANGSFDLSLISSGTVSLFGSADGSSSTRIFMEDTTTTAGDQDLMEFLFSASINDGSVTTSNLIIASLVGEFGSDPFGDSGSTTLLPGGFSVANITLTAVSQVPLPAGLVLLLSALGGLVLVRRRAA